MENLKSQFIKGLDMIQNTVESELGKVEDTLEINSIRNKIKTKEKIRASVILDLGEEYYAHLRGREVSQDRINFLKNEVREIDRQIYKIEKNLARRLKSKMRCNYCGKNLDLLEENCKNCGKSISRRIEEDINLVNECRVCHELVDKDAIFCNICGNKF